MVSNKVNADCPECGAVVLRYVPPMRPMWVRCWEDGEHSLQSVEPTVASGSGWCRLDVEANDAFLLADSTLGTDFAWDAVPPDDEKATSATAGDNG